MIQADFATSPCNIVIFNVLLQDKRHFDTGLILQFVIRELSNEERYNKSRETSQSVYSVHCSITKQLQRGFMFRSASSTSRIP